MPQEQISTSIFRYILFYIHQSQTKRGTRAYHDAHHHWVMADQDVQRDWGW